tara:strand:+ start:11375 stop:12694 length:1320 start_codon:yes stop_codon:yes gene_type:complete
LNTRAAAAQVVASVLRGQSLSAALPPMVLRVEERDRSLLKELCFGSLRWQPCLTLYLEVLITKPLRAKDLEIHALLMIGLYQLLHLRVAEHAVVNETVTATKALKRPWAKAMVNAVLRNFLRQKEALTEQLSPRRAFQSAHPDWLVRAFKDAWSEPRTSEIIAANNARAPMTLRVNTARGSRSDYLERLHAAGLEANAIELTDSGIQLTTPVDVSQLPGFDLGDCSVQDGAAQLAAPLMMLEPGQRVLDACSAPGGKTGHIAEAQPQLDTLLALDSDPRRLQRVRDNFTRLGLEADLREADACDPGAWWDQQLFDRILLDAPCSATGVIRRHPDIKLLRTAADIEKLAAIQGRLLQSLWPTLKNNGVLVYATCSVLPRENDRVIEEFLQAHNDAHICAIDADWGLQTNFGRQLFPLIGGQDGFYYARLQKRRNDIESEK